MLVFVIDGIVIGIFLLFFEFRLLELSLVLTLWVSEVPIGGFLWYLLERRHSARQRAVDAIEIAHAHKEYSHLRILKCNDWEEYDYPLLGYFVLNTTNRRAYQATDWIAELEATGIIRVISFNDWTDIEEHCKTYGIEFLRWNNPSPDDLEKRSDAADWTKGYLARGW